MHEMNEVITPRVRTAIYLICLSIAEGSLFLLLKFTKGETLVVPVFPFDAGSPRSPPSYSESLTLHAIIKVCRAGQLQME